jgi:hypothetical protein
MLCASAIYMGECSACKEVACVFTPEPISDNRLSPGARIPTMLHGRAYHAISDFLL